MVRCREQIGRLPPGVPENVIFLANLECIFFGEPEKTSTVMRHVKGFHGYGARLIPVLALLFSGAGNNLLLLRNPPNRSLLEYFGRLDLSLPEMAYVQLPEGCALGPVVLPDGNKAAIAAHDATLLDGYVTDQHLAELAARFDKRLLKSQGACQTANDKIKLYRFLAAQGLPLFDGGEEVPAAIPKQLAALRARGYRHAVIRAALGASGFGMYVVDLAATEESALTVARFRDASLLVQGWVEEGVLGYSDIGSPSVQFQCLDEGGVILFELTDQLLSDASVHEGNMAPPMGLARQPECRAELLRQAGLVGQWCWEQGYRGPGSVDFLVNRRDGVMEVRVCEVNARVTGATYPALLGLSQNPGGAWLMRNVVLGPCLTGQQFLDLLADKGVLWLPSSTQGIMPINVITDADGQIRKCQLLFLGPTTASCLTMLAAFADLLPASCRFDRD